MLDTRKREDVESFGINVAGLGISRDLVGAVFQI